MVKHATIICLMVGALALVLLLVYGESGGAPTTFADGGNHGDGAYTTTIRCGENTSVEASTAAVSKGAGGNVSIWNKPTGAPACQPGLTDEQDWTIDQRWDGMTMGYQCPKTPQVEDAADKNVLIFGANELKLGVWYALDCPSNSGTHGPTPLPGGGEVGGDGAAGLGPDVTAVRTTRTAGVIGGIAELPEADAAPLEAGDSSGASAGVIAGIAAASVAGAIALGGAGWYARRRLIK